ncbi:putative indigoidine synthase A-like protein [Lyophyllum shimeji]|uniref:Indigoidine synthase A-like protein n=1 Tax=Lyophyllum shimeji TaxID=47721 RepID=A0A9P3PHN1_LYOSH|nr:putative indigoidine synthase A-like protein [Lyophyllum shimeji]
MLLSTAAKRAPSLIPPRATRPLSTLSTALQRDAPLDLHPEVQEALATNKPVVALETAVVTHGFPYPDNIKLATSLETIVRSTGAVPATVGVIRGRIKIGLHEKELARLADKDTHAAKVSRRDIAPAISLKADGGTTCSATLIFAALAGIKVFATGGLGGVHRGGENTMDVSADLNELTRCPVGLVSAGVKSILDIGRTLEYLETLGVPVITYGTTREFPAFFSRRSGFNAPWNINDPVTAARILHTQWQLGLNNGALIAVPISPEFEEAGMFIQKAVDQAVAESEANGVSRLGKEATPWLLARVGELTQGASRESNVALLQNTALVGGHIAVEYQKLLADLPASPHYAIPSTPNVETEVSLPPADLLVVGSAAVDITAKAKAESDKSLAVHSTAPGSVSLSLGGVARNIAEASHRLISARSRPSSCMLVSPIGDDAFGRLLVEETAQLGMRVDGFIKSDRRTAVCNMVLDSDGGLIGGIADMDITAALDGHSIISHIDTQKPRIVAMDGNLSPETIKNVAGHCIRNSIKVFFEPTSVIKSTVIFPAIAASLDVVSDQAPIAFTSPNILELARMLSSAEALDLTSHPAWWRVVDSLSLGPAFRMDLERLAGMNASEEDSSKGTLAFLVDEGIAQMAIKLLPFFQHLVIKCGQAGVVLVMRIPEVQTSQWAAKHSQPAQRYIIARGKSNEAVILCHFPPHRIGKLVNVTGAGDSFVGVLLANLLQFPDACHNPAKLSDVIFAAQSAAILTLQSPHAVSPMLSSI